MEDPQNMDRSVHMTVKLTEAENRAFRVAAAKEGMALSVWVRFMLRKVAPMEEPQVGLQDSPYLIGAAGTQTQAAHQIAQQKEYDRINAITRKMREQELKA